MDEKQYILTIAGFDPSSGAGITSDIKTFESFGLYGLSVCTAITVQNDIEFKSCTWVKETIILEQIETLFERFKIPIVKIGIIESWEVLLKVQQKLRNAQYMNPYTIHSNNLLLRKYNDKYWDTIHPIAMN